MKHLRKQKSAGFTILILAVTLLLISSLLILFSARYSALQQKITANIYSSQQALEAAQAGIEVAIPYFQANYTAILAQQQGGFLPPYTNSNTQNVSLANGSQYSFVFVNPIANNFQLITITATGTNADGSATRTLTQQMLAYSTGFVPTTSATTQGSVLMRNISTINNAQTNANLLTGSTITLNGGAKTTISGGVSSTATQLGSDVSPNNSTLASETPENFFESFFGISASAMQSVANYTYTNSSNTYYNQLNGVTGSIVWINQLADTAIINSNTVVGSVSRPVILVVDGNFILTDFASIYGLVFVLNPTQPTQISSNATINGAFGSSSNVTFRNNAILNYNAAVLNVLPPTGAAPNYAKLPGSWKDF